jgi:hypothetical protein
MTKRKTIHIKLKIEQHEPEGCHDSSSIEYTSGSYISGNLSILLIYSIVSYRPLSGFFSKWIRSW